MKTIIIKNTIMRKAVVGAITATVKPSTVAAAKNRVSTATADIRTHMIMALEVAARKIMRIRMRKVTG
ncbi:hypothetical protein L0N33_21120 [Roseburia faecis]|nr:hypothetical protein [Roseburia faecis]